MTAHSVEQNQILTHGFSGTASVHVQGSLDGLCGVYSIINSLTLMLGENAFDAKALFAVLLRAIPGSLATIAVEGMHKHQYTRLIRVACAHLLNSKIGVAHTVAATCQPDALAEFWNILAAHHAKVGDGSILLGVAGQYDHWTCVRSVEPHRLVLADSGDLTVIERERATIGGTIKRPIIVQPMQAFLLWQTKITDIERLPRRSLSKRQAVDASAEARLVQ